MDDFRDRGILYLETRKKKFGKWQCPRIFASWGGNTVCRARASILCNKRKPRAAGAREPFFKCFSLGNRRESNCEARSAICFVRFCLICSCLFLILDSYGRNVGVLSERYGATMGTLLELVRSNCGPRSLAPSLTPLVVQLLLPVIESSASTDRCEARAAASLPYVFA